MGQFYILVEGVNIYANVFDTSQLSVIRGTSFLYKQVINDVSDTFSQKLTPISTGASSGLYLVKEGYEANQLVNEISNRLNDPKQDFSLLTIIVETCEAVDLLSAKEQLYTQLRIRQMQSSLIVPDIFNNDALSLPDQLEGHRVAGKNNRRMVQGKQRELSSSVCKRLEHGRKLRQNFYFDDVVNKDQDKKRSDLLNTLNDVSFCDDFEELAGNPNYKKLNNKIAVIYMDGNSFSKKQRLLLTKLADDQLNAQKLFDDKIQKGRDNYLLNVLTKLKDDENALIPSSDSDNKKIRLETLLWGGDEMLFVMPAWLGFDFLHAFFKQTKDWTLDDLDEEEKKLTHAAGLVFCSAKTPIRNIRDLAQSIADTIKEVKASPEKLAGREQNSWGYIILESIDYPTNNCIADFNKKYYGETLSESKPMLIPALTTDEYQEIKTHLNELINNQLLAQSQLYKIVHSIKQTQNSLDELTVSWKNIYSLTNEQAEKTHEIEQREYRLLQVSKQKEKLHKHISIIARLFNIDPEKPKERIWLWIYLFELWEYICPEPSERKKEDTK